MNVSYAVFIIITLSKFGRSDKNHILTHMQKKLYGFKQPQQSVREPGKLGKSGESSLRERGGGKERACHYEIKTMPRELLLTQYKECFIS
jgi:hypothetical protein